MALDYGDIVPPVGTAECTGKGEEEKEEESKIIITYHSKTTPCVISTFHLPQCTTTPMRSYILSAFMASSDFGVGVGVWVCVCVCVCL